ncbi:tRNA 2-thiouridine(34) synthase MnmA [Candidatus Nomurabacteria bacterium]|nr:tRNA 2-thiouridine(34) synthase MnmA [Candidatus Nomurabacteria bacterium]
MKQAKKILVCLSGGVDSSVSAALLLDQGYEVTGAYMKQWSDGKDISGVCSWKQDRRDAMRVAAKLEIPFVTLDFEKAYKEWVMGYMFEQYEKGKTPNPDVMCNKFIKFDAWLQKAMEMGFDAMATGHYAAVEDGKLLMAKDENKDQTYFLHQVTSEQLRHVLFPLGGYTKDEVRKLAQKFDLPNADREESMGICFVGEIPINEFLQQKIKKNVGIVRLSSGEEIGEHEGLAFYTIGQRHAKIRGLKSKIVSQLGGGDNTKPLFVLKKDFERNELIVGFDDDPLIHTQEVFLENVHWISGQRPDFPLECRVRLRHRQELQECLISEVDGAVLLKFDHSQRSVTPGQFAVLYTSDECLGGGEIV